MPFVLGDGKNTIKTLIEHLFRIDSYTELNQDEWENIQATLNFFGKKSTDVLNSGENQIIDFKYVTRQRVIEDIKISSDIEHALLEQLSRVGNVVWELGRPEAGRVYIYTVDAILDSDKRFWILEANANPIVHPFVYGEMVELLAG